MRSLQISGLVFALVVATFGCASTEDEETSAPRDWANEPDGKKAANGETPAGGTTPTPTTENELAACKPKTCAELGKTSGPADDGCGKTLSCGTVATCTDAKESNNKKEVAADLGAMTDNPASSRIVADLTLADGDEDWFKFKVTDAGFGGNPRIDVSVTVATAEVSVFFVCDSQPDYSECATAGDTADETIGKGCRAKGKVALTTNCAGITETGMAYVRVKKSAADQQCTTYALTVKVD
jgi:hypothetical protein